MLATKRGFFSFESRRRPPPTEKDQGTNALPLIGTRLRGRLVRLAPEIMDRLVAGSSARTIFHIHGGRQTLLWSLSSGLRRRSIPYAVTIHGRYSHLFDQQGQAARRLPLAYLKLIERPVLNAARLVQAVSPAEAIVIRRIAPNAAVECIPNAAYSSAIEGIPAAPKRSAQTSGEPVFGFCGRYEIEHKGLDLLIEGFALYRRGGGRGRLALIGTGPSREQLVAMASRLGLADVTTVDGPRFGEEKTAALQSWDFFVQSSRFDGVPVGALEAALLGLPLIVTEATGLTEHLATFKSGVAITGFTREAVANALNAAERMPPNIWTETSQNAYAMARSVGDWTTIAQRLRSLYQSK